MIRTGLEVLASLALLRLARFGARFRHLCLGWNRSASMDQSSELGEGNLNPNDCGNDAGLYQSTYGCGVESPTPHAPRRGSNFALLEFMGLGVPVGAIVPNCEPPTSPRGIVVGNGEGCGEGCEVGARDSYSMFPSGIGVPRYFEFPPFDDIGIKQQNLHGDVRMQRNCSSLYQTRTSMHTVAISPSTDPT